MTTEVTIKNFQSIKHISFKIDGFTVIVGKNNIGKSAVIRAIDAALSNELGKEFIRNGEKETEVRIVKDGLDILWKKGESSSYKINGEDFTKLNRAIPRPLIEAGFEKMQIDDKPVNPLIAHQFEPLFLLNKRGSVITEVLTALYDMDIISIADDLCQKDLKGQKSVLKTREQDLKTLKVSLDTYKNFEEIKETVRLLGEQEITCDALKAEVLSIGQYADSYSTLLASVNKLKGIKTLSVPSLSKITGLFAETEWLLNKDSEFRTTAEKFKKLRGIRSITLPDTKGVEIAVKELTAIQEADKLYTELNTSMKEQKALLNQLDMQGIGTLMSSVMKADKDFEELKQLEQDFTEVAKKAKSTREEIKTLDVKLKAQKDELAKIKVCPLCKAEIK